MSWTHHRARVAALARDREPNDPDLLAARRDLAAERLADHVAHVLAQAPPLTDAQLQRVTAILRPTLRPTTEGQVVGHAG
ncbi:hypothetical protein NF556_11600 [Ornithinimicrobium faecis]|uniref:PhiRv1 phage protein n=1 Tax=Ornithinimicrobium faecis TaxID=2934158 RepID=A0ABY4YNB6_9MICO|nr:hypothetical protein [Ornithinimicrobium sp. HY1793]USQ78298.1 hypothetical protein NF556_11600 [Ornithinimicrobium sp. HY1793]